MVFPLLELTAQDVDASRHLLYCRLHLNKLFALVLTRVQVLKHQGGGLCTQVLLLLHQLLHLLLVLPLQDVDLIGLFSEIPNLGLALLLHLLIFKQLDLQFLDFHLPEGRMVFVVLLPQFYLGAPPFEHLHSSPGVLAFDPLSDLGLGLALVLALTVPKLTESVFIRLLQID